MKPNWHWSNKPEPERRVILKKISVGWGKKPRTGKWLVCPICSKKFYRKRCHMIRSKTNYCSKRCLGDAKKGRIPPNLERARKNSPIQKGKDNINWKGGLPRPYPDEWNGTLKNRVWIRDNNTCQICGKKGRKRSDLLCHHIDFNKKNCSFENLQLLCRSCHMRVHWRRKKILTVTFG